MMNQGSTSMKTFAPTSVDYGVNVNIFGKRRL